MTPRQVYENFRFIFPNYDTTGIEYFPNGKNCIRIRGIGDLKHIGNEFIFRYNNLSDWTFESFQSFLRRMKGEK